MRARRSRRWVVSGSRGTARRSLAAVVFTTAITLLGTGIISGVPAGAALPVPANRTVVVTCPDLGTVDVSLPSGAATTPLPADVQLLVAFSAFDARTRTTVTGGAGGNGIECNPVPFTDVPAADVVAAPLPAGLDAKDRLTGAWHVTIVVSESANSRSSAAALPATASPFLASIQSYISSRADAASVAVFDATDGATYNVFPQGSYITASIVKVDILETLLYQTQAAGRGLTSQEQATAAQMIEVSDNNAATALWNEVGGGPGVARYNQLVGMPNTIPGSGGLWGLTRTTAQDQVQLVRTLAYGNAILSDSRRGYALSLMQNVTSSQRWGVSGGVPAGVGIALKNGWLSVTGGWEINSIGHIAGGGRDYVIAVLTAGNSSMGYGINTIQGVSSIVWSQMPKSLGGLTSGYWYLRNELSSGPGDTALAFAIPGDLPVVGDWNRDGIDTPGVFRGTTWYLRNENSSGPGDVSFLFGIPGDLPVAGDWLGQGFDSVGVFRNGTWYLRNELTSGPGDISFVFGGPGDIPVVGDWTGSGRTGIGVVRGTTWYLKNVPSAGPADFTLSYGITGDAPVVGDWTGTGKAGIGVFRNGVWYLRNELTSGPGDVTFSFGIPGDIPIAGSWTGVRASLPGVAR
ncbi:MAG TPA: serine hydrolase [Acidimicrobiales bacterium]|nr:serine hydrolase [Acidimicrobiales bacterium]